MSQTFAGVWLLVAKKLGVGVAGIPQRGGGERLRGLSAALLHQRERDGLRVQHHALFKIGVSFDSSKRCVAEWKIGGKAE